MDEVVGATQTVVLTSPCVTVAKAVVTAEAVTVASMVVDGREVVVSRVSVHKGVVKD